MPKIAEVLEQLGCTKDELALAYQKLFAKKLTGQVSAANMKPLKDYFAWWSQSTSDLSESKSSKWTAKTSKTTKSLSPKDSWDAHKVLKAEELFASTSFLSWLGFDTSKKVETSDDDAEELRVHAPWKLKETVVEEKPVQQQSSHDYSQARVISRATSAQQEQLKQGFNPNKKFQVQKKPEDIKWIQQWIRYFNQNDASKTKRFPDKFQPKQQVVQQPKVVKESKTSSTLIKKEDIIMPATITVKELSEKMGVPLADLIKTLLSNKILAWVNTSLDFDTVSLIGMELWVNVKKETTAVAIGDVIEGNLNSILDLDKDSEWLEERAPIVTIMGHVDHGKTSLLDALRKTEVAKGEAGGITQSIGASCITHDHKQITFIDTPGHELFTAIRARGAKVTNVAVIVVAADDGIKQQTVESINHAKEAWVSIIVAITKIDKQENNSEHIKSQLTEHGLVPEERWGDVPVVPVSSMTGQWLDLLMDTILLKAHELNLRYNPKREAVCVVLESHRDSKQGVTTTLLLLTWSLKVWDVLVIKNTYGRVRRMLDRKGKEMKIAYGGQPVLILGIPEVTEPGSIAEVVKNEKIASDRVSAFKKETVHQTHTLAGLMNKLTQGEHVQLNLILKADTRGSLEALKQAIGSASLPETVEIKVVHSDVGTFSESDLALAQASGALLLGFSIPLHASLKKRAELLQVQMKSFDIIYELIDYLHQLVQGMVIIEQKEVVIGQLKVLGIFYKKEKEMIIGGKVMQWKVRNGAMFRVLRGEEILSTGTVTSLKRDQENVDEVSEGHECGMKVKVGKKIEENDILEFYVME